MRNLRHWGIYAALLVGLGTTGARGADPEKGSRAPKASSQATSSWSWMNPARWFGSKEPEKTAEPKGKKDSRKGAADKTEPAPLPSAAEEMRSRRAREEADLFRRLEVCDRLREIALRTEDQELLRRVEELTERAFTVYTQRTGTRSLAIGGNLEDETALQRRSRPEPIHSVTSGNTNRRAAVKEVDR